MAIGKNSSESRFLPGDWLVLLCALLMVAASFRWLWHDEQASRLLIRQGGQLLASYSLNQSRQLHIHGPLGESTVQIEHGQARFISSPCSNQYCVHQGWLRKAGQIALCLPNQVSLELSGAAKAYDSLNY